VITQHSEPYNKIRSTHILYGFSFTAVDICNLQNCLSRLSISSAKSRLVKELISHMTIATLVSISYVFFMLKIVKKNLEISREMF